MNCYCIHCITFGNKKARLLDFNVQWWGVRLDSTCDCIWHLLNMFKCIEWNPHLCSPCLTCTCENVLSFVCLYILAWRIPAFTAFSCERDELADVVDDLKHGSVIGSHRRGLSLYKKTFSGDQLVDWLQKEKGMGK